MVDFEKLPDVEAEDRSFEEEHLLEEELDEVAGGVAVRLPTDPPGFHFRPRKTGYEYPSRKQ